MIQKSQGKLNLNPRLESHLTVRESRFMQSQAGRQLHRVHLELTNVCNCRCDFCAGPTMERSTRHMDLELAKRLISEIDARSLCRELTFHLLGEPSLHPHFFSILGFASRTGLQTSLVTNGILLGDDFGTKLRTRSLDQLTISLQTPDKFSFSFRNAPISFDDYKDGLLRFLTDTYADWSKSTFVIRFLSTHFFDKIHVLKSSYGDACSDFSAQRMAMKAWAREIYSAIGADETDVERALQKLDSVQIGIWNRIWIHHRIRFDIWHMLDWIDWSSAPDAPEVQAGDCFYRKDHIAILSNGDVVLCSLDFNGRTTLGNVSDSTLRDVILSNKAQHVFSEFEHGRVSLPYCRKCMASWERILKALGLGTTTIAAQQAIQTTFHNECRIW